MSTRIRSWRRHQSDFFYQDAEGARWSPFRTIAVMRCSVCGQSITQGYVLQQPARTEILGALHIAVQSAETP